MATYNEIKSKYEQDQSGMQQGLQQVPSSKGVAEGVGTLIGLGIRSSRMSQQNAKIEALNQALKTSSTQMDQGLYEEAIATTTKKLVSCEIAEGKVQGFHIRGTAYFLREQYDKAIEDLTEAIRIIETSPVQLDRDALGDSLVSSYYVRGKAFEKQNKPSDALRDFTKAIRLEPGWDVLYYSRCLVLRTVGEYDQAQSDINQAITIEPGDAGNYRERGRLYALTGDPKRALDDFSRAITLQRSVVNLRARGQFYVDQNEQAKALTDYSAALALDPNDLKTLKLRAELLKALGSDAEADADLAHAAESEKQQSTYQSYLDTAKGVYDKGVTQTWTEADTKAKPNYLVAIVLGILTFFGTSVALLFAAGIGGDGSGLCLLAGLVLAPVLGVMVTINQIKNPKQRAKSAMQYFAEMATCEKQMPRFSEFYGAYLKARTDGALPKLWETTQFIFE